MTTLANILDNHPKNIQVVQDLHEEDYNGGGAYRAFLKLFYKAKIEDDKKK